ncbi:HAD-IA family hydrolase [bacterium]|nr:HAD-IA family hydrolase [bacterium]
MLKYQNYIFDLDGTLINSSEEVLNCFEKAFKEANYDIDNSKLTSDVIGPPLRQIIQTIAPELVDDDKINDIMLNFRRIYDYDENDISIMYDEIYDLLCDLKNKGYKLYIATFKPKIPTMRIVKKFHLDEIFNDVYTIDKFGTKITKEEMILNIISSYNLEKDQTVMIGDALSDMIASKKAGIDGIGVLWGYGSDKEPLKENSKYVVKDVKELRECLK